MKDARLVPVLDDRDRPRSISEKLPQDGKSQVGLAAARACGDEGGPGPSLRNRLEGEREVRLVLIGIEALDVERAPRLDQSAALIAHRVCIAHKETAGKTGVENRIEPPIDSDETIARSGLPL